MTVRGRDAAAEPTWTYSRRVMDPPPRFNPTDANDFVFQTTATI